MSSFRIDVSDLRVCQLLAAYLEFADGYYRKNGQPTKEADNMELAARSVPSIYSNARVADIGLRELKAVREVMIGNGLARRSINARINRIRRIFKWGVEEGMIEPSILQALQAVAPLKMGRTSARETDPARPAPQEHTDAVVNTVTSQIRAMIEVQLLTGMRPGEVVQMRPCEIDRSEGTWVFRPPTHKTEHYEIERRVFIGPKAQQILQPFLLRDDDAYIFDPREAILEMRAQQRARSKKPEVQGRKSYNLRSLRRIGSMYTTKSYRQAIRRGCERAGVPNWSPNQLRHNAATFLREQFGIEVARVILGHTSAAVTEIYAEVDRTKAADIMGQVG